MKRSYVTWLNVEYPSTADRKEIDSKLEDLVDSKPLPKGLLKVEVHTPVKVEDRIIAPLCIPFRSQSLQAARKNVKAFVAFFCRETGMPVKVSVPATSWDV